jgi:hypothetical protein
MSYVDIAQVCACSLGTVKSRLHYALARLRILVPAGSSLEPASARRATPGVRKPSSSASREEQASVSGAGSPRGAGREAVAVGPEAKKGAPEAVRAGP